MSTWRRSRLATVSAMTCVVYSKNTIERNEWHLVCYQRLIPYRSPLGGGAHGTTGELAAVERLAASNSGRKFAIHFWTPSCCFLKIDLAMPSQHTIRTRTIVPGTLPGSLPVLWNAGWLRMVKAISSLLQLA